jgi:YebC/PmpR family DNA-binding regulatory protein
MSGHSKWSTIKHAKAITDAKRGKVFSRVSKMISIAVKEGGNDNPEFNPSLRLAIDKAKEANMPKENVKRAIDKGAGRIEGASYEELTYEGFAPGKVSMIVECVTDNRNRTNSEVKTLFDKNGGVLGSTGSVNYNFNRTGIIEIIIPNDKDSEELQLDLIDEGADDFEMINDKKMRLIVDASQTHLIAEKLKNKGLEVTEVDVIMKPNIYIDLDEKVFSRFEKFFQIIDNHEDVQKIYSNEKKAF